MHDLSPWEVLGWTGNACFFARFLVQWLASERASKSVAPAAFWWLSLAGSMLVAAYVVDLGEPILLIGLIVNGLVYARNLWLETGAQRGRVKLMTPFYAALLALAVAIAVVASGFLRLREGWTAAPGWLICVAVGQSIWSSRFLLQWWYSERSGASQFTRGFWWMSLAGNSLLLAYAVHLADAVLIAGYAVGPVVQVRNLMLGAGARWRATPIQNSPG